MKLVIAGLVLASVLTGCGSQTTCYGVEPDNEREILRPCPQGWADGEQRQIREDEFADLEVDVKTKKTKKLSPTKR